MAFARLRPGPALLVFLLAAAVPLLLTGGDLDPSTYPKLAAACVLLGSIPIWSRLWPRPTGRGDAWGNPVLIALSMFMVVQAFSLFRSYLPEEGIWTLLLRGLPGAIALLVVRASADFPQAMRDLSRAAAAGVLAQCAIGGLQYFDLGFQGLPGSPYLPQGTLANKNVFAAWLAMGLPLSAYALTDASRAWRRTALAAGGAASSLIAVAYCRTGWLILAGFLAAGAAGCWCLRGSAEGRALRRVLLTGASAAFLALLWDGFHPPRHLAYRAQPAYGEFPDRFASIAAPGDLRNRERLELWRHTLAMATGNPWTGVGAGGWKLAYPAYAAPAGEPARRVVSPSPDPSVFPASPHDDFLLIGAESGLPGLLAYLSVFGAAAAMLAAGRSGLGAQARFARFCLFAALGAYLTDAAFNFPGDRAEPAILLGLVLGTVALAKDASPGPWRIRRDGEGEAAPFTGADTGMGRRWRAADLVVAFLAMGGLGLCLGRWDAETHLRRGLEARANGDWTEAERELSRADRPWYPLDRAGTPVAFYRATTALGAGRRDEAKSFLDRAYQVNPLHIHVLNDLGSLEVASGRFGKGIAWYEKCLALRPDFTEARENLAAAWCNAGQLHKAKETLAAIPPQARTPRAEAYDRKLDELLKERSGYE